MRFISLAVAALISNTAAKDETLINQLSSLKQIVRNTDEWNTDNMVSVISARKDELEMDLKNKNKSKKEVADELKYLLELVRDIESNDKSHAVQTLVSRKSSLMNLEGEEGKDETKEKELTAKEKETLAKADEELTKAKDAVTDAEEALAEAEKTYKEKEDPTDDDKLPVDEAEKAVDEAKEEVKK